MACPICDNKPANCDCTESERWQHEEIERLVAELERHRMTPQERHAVACAAGQEELLATVNDDDVSRWHAERAMMLRALLARTAPEAK